MLDEKQHPMNEHVKEVPTGPLSRMLRHLHLRVGMISGSFLCSHSVANDMHKRGESMFFNTPSHIVWRQVIDYARIDAC